MARKKLQPTSCVSEDAGPTQHDVEGAFSNWSKITAFLEVVVGDVISVEGSVPGAPESWPFRGASRNSVGPNEVRRQHY